MKNLILALSALLLSISAQAASVTKEKALSVLIAQSGQISVVDEASNKSVPLSDVLAKNLLAVQNKYAKPVQAKCDSLGNCIVTISNHTYKDEYDGDLYSIIIQFTIVRVNGKLTIDKKLVRVSYAG